MNRTRSAFSILMVIMAGMLGGAGCIADAADVAGEIDGDVYGTEDVDTSEAPSEDGTTEDTGGSSTEPAALCSGFACHRI